MFVWARVVCGTRYGPSPYVGTSPVTGKIHMQKIECLQSDDCTCDKMKNFSIGRRFRASNNLFWAHERVLTHSVERSKWLEELASESNAIQAQGNVTRQGRFEVRTQ